MPRRVERKVSEIRSRAKPRPFVSLVISVCLAEVKERKTQRRMGRER